MKMNVKVIYVMAILAAASCAPLPREDDRAVNGDQVRVVGYLFEDTTDSPSLLRPNGIIDTEKLSETKQREVVLTKAQVEMLVDASFHADRFRNGAACYHPHHIFVFYDINKTPLEAIEVCFSCENISVMPRRTSPKTNWAALAKLSDKLGLGLGPGYKNLDAFLEQLHENSEDSAD